MTDERVRLHFDLFGSFAGRQEEAGETRNCVIPDKLGKKALSFLQYLIVNHGRSISSEELIEVFWPETDRGNPANSLKNMLFKTRKVLKDMFPGQEKLLATLQGCYAWDGAVTLILDSEEFEKLCLSVRKQSGKPDIEELLRAASLYKGAFLAGNDSDWAVSLRRYYQTLYLDLCRLLLPLLQKEERWIEIISTCEQAFAAGASTEIFPEYQMQALIAIGQPEQAIEVYRTFREMFWEEFEIAPGEQLEQLYILAEGMCRNHIDEQDVLRLVAETEMENQAFFCTFGVFQNIVALEKRHLARSGRSTTLLRVSLGRKVTPATDARRLERVLLDCLRTGDPISRLNADSYILMLTGASEENARLVTERIDRAFHKAYSHSKACLSFRILPLENNC